MALTSRGSLVRVQYLGSPDPRLEATGVERRYDLFLLCDLATPFEQDHTGLRQDGDRRAWMHRRLSEYVESHDAPALCVTGTPDERRDQAIQAIDQLMTSRRS